MTNNLSKKLTITEIFYSIQGESYLAGLPCIFVRLTGCHQRCVYCDTEYSFFGGSKMTLAEILSKIESFPCKNILLTGGEPLLQENLPLLAKILLENNYRVAIETGGNRDVGVLPKEVIKIVDLKTPASSECERNNYDNIAKLDRKDEIKFVVMNENDIAWSLDQVISRRLTDVCHVSFSPTDKKLLPFLAKEILETGFPIRLQTQFHKQIWPEKDRGF